MKELKKLTMIIILILTTHFGYSQYDHYGNSYEGKSQSNFLKTNNYYSVVYVIPSPTSSTTGITFDGNSLWVASTNDTLYMISPTDGSVQKALNININYITGITFVEPNLYAVDKNNKKICKIDTANGNIIDFFYTPEFNVNGFPGGLTWDENNLWYSCGEEVDSIYELNLSGQVISQHKVFGETPTGLTFDGSNLWSVNTDLDIIYQISLPSFVLIDSIPAPGGEHPNGLAFDGQYLWVSNNETDSIYQLEIGITTIENSNNLVNETMIVWPNPSFDFINVEIPTKNAKNVVFQIYTLNGQIAKTCLKQENMHTNYYKLNLSNLESGIYILTTNINDKKLYSKIMIK